ncbi:hypothetical protein TanjilG_27594 [Lupinus angustifolius]|uniref:DUF4228 domain-containing protein n=1 Tax=Lupinus angustifolius TaxID=3871 RepID=A0A4P1R440_LUPAN|nr:hypothetical protein TanjilG_27594 [Lupinus angustifolius]
MGNCQAIDTATIVIQQPNGKVEKLYWPVSASEVMKTNPGHYVALLISTTLCTSKDKDNCPNKSDNNNKNNSVRLTRIKLLKPTDTLVLGQVYRLISTKEVMKGLWAKKQAKLKKNLPEPAHKTDQVREKPVLEMDEVARRSEPETNQPEFCKMILHDQLEWNQNMKDMGQGQQNQLMVLAPRLSQEHGNHLYIASQKHQVDLCFQSCEGQRSTQIIKKQISPISMIA